MPRSRPSRQNGITSHTAVPRGTFAQQNDYALSRDLLRGLGVDMEKAGVPARRSDFNMTTLAVRGSRFHNGVSRVHGA
jgi:starch phosphorylase